jgi:hypothetical protein
MALRAGSTMALLTTKAGYSSIGAAWRGNVGSSIKDLMKAAWMSEVKVGEQRRSLLSKRVFTVVSVDWGVQMVGLKDDEDNKQLVRLERIYEYFERA